MLIDIKIGIIARKYMNICRTLFSVKVKALLAASVLFWLDKRSSTKTIWSRATNKETYYQCYDIVRKTKDVRWKDATGSKYDWNNERKCISEITYHLIIRTSL